MRLGYAVSQWKHLPDRFVRLEQHERAFKTIAATGFTEIELRAGTSRWEPLGRPDRIAQFYGSTDRFLAVLRSFGLDRVTSFFFDPAQPFVEEASRGADPANREHRAEIVRLAEPFVDFLAASGGSTLVVRPVGSRWRVGRPSSSALDEIAATWNAVGEMTSKRGINVALHVDSLSALQTYDEVSDLLSRTSEHVGLALDTAEFAICGIDPVWVYEQQAAKVFHVHLKDAKETDTLNERTVENAEMRFLSAGGQRGVERWFWELGAGGLVDFPRLFEKLVADGYQGSLIVESEQSPDPAGSAMLNGWYLKRHGPALRS